MKNLVSKLNMPLSLRLSATLVLSALVAACGGGSGNDLQEYSNPESSFHQEYKERKLGRLGAPQTKGSYKEAGKIIQQGFSRDDLVYDLASDFSSIQVDADFYTIFEGQAPTIHNYRFKGSLAKQARPSGTGERLFGELKMEWSSDKGLPPFVAYAICLPVETCAKLIIEIWQNAQLESGEFEAQKVQYFFKRGPEEEQASAQAVASTPIEEAINEDQGHNDSDEELSEQGFKRVTEIETQITPSAKLTDLVDSVVIRPNVPELEAGGKVEARPQGDLNALPVRKNTPIVLPTSPPSVKPKLPEVTAPEEEAGNSEQEERLQTVVTSAPTSKIFQAEQEVYSLYPSFMKGTAEEVGYSVGTYANGSLKHSVLLPDSEDGCYQKNGSNHWGVKPAIEMIKYSCGIVREVHTDLPPLVITSISKKNGGNRGVGASHHIGHDIDLRYLGTTVGGRVSSKDHASGYHLPKGKFSYDENFDFLRLWEATGHLERVFVSRSVKRGMCRWKAENGIDHELDNKLFSKLYMTGVAHDNHMHIRLTKSDCERNDDVCVMERVVKETKANGEIDPGCSFEGAQPQLTDRTS